MFDKLIETISFGKHTDDLLNEANNLMSHGKYQEAREPLNKCIELQPNWSKPYRYRAWIYAIHNYELDDALNDINKCLRACPNITVTTFRLTGGWCNSIRHGSWLFGC
jgi:tetratricopeptide (TPR) repeat protein